MRKEKKKEKDKTLPVDRWPRSPTPTAYFLPFSLVGRRSRARFSVSLLRPRGPVQEAAAAARLPSLRRWRAGPVCQPRLLPLAVAELETDAAPNRINRVSRDFLPENVMQGL
jgi:hypothetical protein